MVDLAIAVVKALNMPVGRVEWRPGIVEVVLPDSTAHDELCELAQGMVAIRPDGVKICVMRERDKLVCGRERDVAGGKVRCTLRSGHNPPCCPECVGDSCGHYDVGMHCR